MHSTRALHYSPSNVNVGITLLLAPLLLILLFLLVTAQPAYAQNSVPSTARQAATMPHFAARVHPASQNASRLPHLIQPQASYKHPHDVRQRGLLPNDDIVYTNGPINGTTDAWTINFGFIVSNSFNVTGTGTSVRAMSFGAWLFPGDVVQSVELSITDSEFGGNTYFDGVVYLTQSGCSGNQYGFNICTVATNSDFGPVNLDQGTYWVNLQNATVNTGDPVYWDENSGPSLASQNSVGTIPSEAFTLLGSSTTTSCYPFCEPPPPECVHNVPGDNFEVIHNFTGNDPTPGAGLAIDPAGKVYGTTGAGGDYGLGSAYQLAVRGQDWIFTSLYSFMDGTNGYNPGSAEVVGPDGAIYGTAQGGIPNCGPSGTEYCGVVYQLRPTPNICLTAQCNWMETAIYRFTGDPDGWAPNGNLVFDQAGHVYGTALQGGAHGLGAIYELTRSNGGWTERLIYSFTGGYDGAAPGSLLLGHDGNLYGISAGRIFQLAQSGGSWAFTVVASPGCTGLVQDSGGNLYCLDTVSCGEDNHNRCGIIYGITYGDWRVTDLEDTFNRFLCAYHYCYVVYYSLAVDPADRLYVTEGSSTCDFNCFYYDGNIHRVPFFQYFDVLVDIGGDVFRDLQVTPNRKFYGTTGTCGSSKGTVWQLTPP